MAKKYYGDVKRSVAGSESGEMRKAMLHEDHSKPSNLPQEVMMKEYPSTDFFNSYIDDSIYGIDNQMQNGVQGLKKQIRSRMF